MKSFWIAVAMEYLVDRLEKSKNRRYLGGGGEGGRAAQEEERKNLLACEILFFLDSSHMSSAYNFIISQ